MNYSYSQLITLALNAGFSPSQAFVAAAVAMAESSGNPDAVNHNTNGSVDCGLWQINSVHSSLPLWSKRFDPQSNADMAYIIWQEHRNFTPWTTYTNGAYRKYVNYHSQVSKVPNMTKNVPSSGQSYNATNTGLLSNLGGALGGIGLGNGFLGGLGGGLLGGGGSVLGLGSKFAELFTAAFWERVAYVIGGFWLIVVGLVFMAESNKTVRKASVNAATAAAVA